MPNSFQFSAVVLTTLFLGLSACVPKDPAVLSAQEKEDQLKKKNKAKPPAVDTKQPDPSGLAPASMDLKYADVSIEKMNEISQYLLMALELNEKRQLSLGQNIYACKKSESKVSGTDARLIVDIKEEGCERAAGDLSVQRNQKLQMVLSRTEGKITSIEVRTLGSGEEAAFGRKITYKNKTQQKRKLDVQEWIDIQLVRDDSSDQEKFLVLGRQSLYSKQSGVKNEQSNITLGIEGVIQVKREARENQDPLITLKPELSSFLQAHLSNDTTRSYFSLALSQNPEILPDANTCPNQAPGFRMNFQYKPEKSRKNAVLMKSVSGLQVKDEKGTAQLDGACSRGDVPWDSVLFF
ncbi:MAG: hypothetical protein BroJett040_23130 [Oligoflexia bacterium]|nr:MAG: hypothetical protein BroJett040_23130 [Oligoflexia bacterium]